MLKLSRKILTFSIICSLAFVIIGCSKPVRHISSDVCLIKQGNSQKDVLAVLGQPESKEQAKEGETWTYYSAQRSALKRTPVLGLMFGSVSYDVVHVTFTGNTVTNCQYRYGNEEEFHRFKTKIKEQ